jgi:hypothetical protein
MGPVALAITAALYLVVAADYYLLEHNPWLAGVFICYAGANLFFIGTFFR